MLFTKYLLTIIGSGFLLGAAAMLIHDLYQIFRRPYPITAVEPDEPKPVRWRASLKLAGIGVIPLLIGLSIAVVPGGFAAVRVSQLTGAAPGTLYPGVHLVLPLAERLQLFETRDHVISTILADDPKKPGATLRVQTKEGLSIGLAVTVRFKLDASKLDAIYSNLPQPVDRRSWNR